MWNHQNSYSRLQYNNYSARRQQELIKHKKYKLLIMLLGQSTHRYLRGCLLHIKHVTSHDYKLFSRMNSLALINMSICTKIAFQKIKQRAFIHKSQQKCIKNTVVLLNRMQKYKLKQCFAQIVIFSQKKYQKIAISYDKLRGTMLYKKLLNLVQKTKQKNFNKIAKYSRLLRQQTKKIKITYIIATQYLKNIKQACFNRLRMYNKQLNSTNLRNGKNLSVTAVSPIKQANNLKLQVKQLANQLQSKNQSISRLQQEIIQLKMEQPTNNYNSFSEYTLQPNGALNKSASKSAKKYNSNNDSIDNSLSGMDFSIGSILGSSFMSLSRSRSKSIKKGQSINSIDCNCGYREKYLKYKNSNDSLKNQLQIVKQELEVAKDLNDHFTNQIRQYFGGQKNQLQLDHLRRELNDLKKQRDGLRDKVIKYQHHISNMKSQFKLKIQELYRKVKKQR